MKKIIIALSVLFMSTISAKAVDLSVLSLTAGLAANQSVFGASARETNDDHSGNTV